MNAPLNRDEQIKLMKDAKERHVRLMQTWVKDSTVRGALSRPAPGQKTVSSYMRTDSKLVRCG